MELNRSGVQVAGGSGAIKYRLGDPFPSGLGAVDALVHAAYDFKAIRWEDIHEINVEGTAQLFDSAHNIGVRKLLNISSMSAFEGCLSLYGKAKLLTEPIVARLGGISLRPGLIFDEEQPKGMVGKLRVLVSRIPLIPLPGNGQNILYFSHQEDLCLLVEDYCSTKSIASEYYINSANSQPWMFRDILRELAFRQKREISFISTPWQLTWGALKLPELFGISPPFKSDSLISLLNQNPTPHFDNSISSRFRQF